MSGPPNEPSSRATAIMSRDEFDMLLDEVSLLSHPSPGPDKVVGSAGLVLEGRVVRLGHDIDANASHPPPAVVIHHMTRLGDQDIDEPSSYMDFIGIAYHGKGITHVDALSHIAYRGRYHGGVIAADVMSSHGSSYGSVCDIGGGIVGRGILIDLANTALASDTAGYSWEHLRTHLDAHGLALSVGDTALFRFASTRAATEPAGDAYRLGLQPSAMAALCKAGVVCCGSDTD